MKQLLLFFFFFFSITCHSQQKVADSLPFQKEVSFKYSSLLLPTGLVSYGILGIKNDPVRKWDRDIRKSLDPNGTKTSVDDYILFTPIAAAYGLDLAGIKGRNNMLDKSIILGTSTLLLYSSVNIIKNNTNIRRPSGKSQSSFPSGHTAISFMAAEFLHQEYGQVSLWYSIAGYSMATATGFLRMYNDKHWFSDVMAGAGIGILSTKIAYWLYPLLKNVIFKNRNKTLESQVQFQLTPLYTGNELLLATSLRF
ncbi:phosphatase PAP2 family protein [uncultured Nonlabens sp.]|uniref:phosphatase PAP2 family protein n=1 Tax=uncultured Nonlabens sp. TaxID=859306 RepID=UPI0030DAF6AC|tara:strand:+ start:6231 stop:6989 length:759 start_codon:yes stop_codon:yes gene_type:complete